MKKQRLQVSVVTANPNDDALNKWLSTGFNRFADVAFQVALIEEEDGSDPFCANIEASRHLDHALYRICKSPDSSIDPFEPLHVEIKCSYIHLHVPDHIVGEFRKCSNPDGGEDWYLNGDIDREHRLYEVLMTYLRMDINRVMYEAFWIRVYNDEIPEEFLDQRKSLSNWGMWLPRIGSIKPEVTKFVITPDETYRPAVELKSIKDVIIHIKDMLNCRPKYYKVVDADDKGMKRIQLYKEGVASPEVSDWFDVGETVADDVALALNTTCNYL